MGTAIKRKNGTWRGEPRVFRHGKTVFRDIATFDTKRAALAWANETEARARDLLKSGRALPTQLTLAQAIEIWEQDTIGYIKSEFNSLRLSLMGVIMQMHNPPHPGSILKEDVLPDLGLTVTQAAEQLGVSRVQFSRFINGRAGVTPDLAIRLSKWIPAPTAIMWLQMQADYDLWQAEHSGRELRVEPAHAMPAPTFWRAGLRFVVLPALKRAYPLPASCCQQ